MYWRRWSQSNCQQWNYTFGATSAAARFWSPLANFMLWRRYLDTFSTKGNSSHRKVGLAVFGVISSQDTLALVTAIKAFQAEDWPTVHSNLKQNEQIWIDETSLQLPRSRSKSPRRCAIEEASSATWSRTTGVSTRRTYVANWLDERKAPFWILVNQHNETDFLRGFCFELPPSLQDTYIEGPKIGPMIA